MSAETTAKTDVSRSNRTWVRRRVHLTFWAPTVLIFVPALFMLMTYGTEISLIAGQLMSGEVTFAHPDYKELHNDLDGLVIRVGALIATLGIYLLFWVRWYRKVLRMTKDVVAVETA